MDNDAFLISLKNALKVEEIRKIIKEIIVEEDLSSDDTLSGVDIGILYKKIEEDDKMFQLLCKLLHCTKEELPNTVNEIILQTEEQNDRLKALKSEKMEIEEQVASQESDLVGVTRELESLKKDFSDELFIYAVYRKLSDSTKSSLSWIFKDDSIQGFLSCGVQERNIDSLWEYIKNEIIEDSNPDISHLIKIFTFFFERYRLAFPFYKIQKVEPNEEFDPLKHIKIGDKASGTIKEIVLPGWINTKTDKIVKSTVVRL